MRYLLRALRLLSVVVWVGGLTFFAAIEAPSAFHVLGLNQDFALLIAASIRGINQLGHVAGFVFLIATIFLWRRAANRTRRLLGIEMVLVAVMIAVTAYVQLGIVPAMDRDRASAGGDISSLPATNPTHADFDRLHDLSEKIEGSAILLGYAVVLLMAGEGTQESTSLIATR